MRLPRLKVGLALLFITLTCVAEKPIGDPNRGQKISESCAACHMPDGNSTVGLWPKIAGQHENYLREQLFKVREGAEGPRPAPTMYPFVQSLTDQDLYDLAAYFAGQEMSEGIAQSDKLERGEQLYRGGDIKLGIPACAACHAPQGQGNAPGLFPRLAGQHAEYIKDQLEKYRGGERRTDPNGLMRGIAKRLTDEDIEALANYVQGLY